jgi:two-component system, NarL family, sensor kinase
MIKEVHREIRSLSFMAHPPQLADYGLAAALERLSVGFAAHTGLEVDFQASDVGEASASVEAAIYRLAQEALSNIHRHASATHAAIRLVGTKRCIHLIMSDDGIGFDTHDDHGRTPIGVGVDGMKERVRELGGRWSIRRIEKGMALSVSLPRRKADAVR